MMILTMMVVDMTMVMLVMTMMVVVITVKIMMTMKVVTFNIEENYDFFLQVEMTTATIFIQKREWFMIF